MNNINTQELNRAIVTDSKSAQTGKDAASKASPSGNDLPVAKATVEAPQEPKQSAPAQQPDRVAKAVAQLNDYVQSRQRDLRFSVDDSLGRSVVSVIDRDSQEVIRQIPNETALQLARNLKDQQRRELELPNEQSSAVGASLGLINTRI